MTALDRLHDVKNGTKKVSFQSGFKTLKLSVQAFAESEFQTV